MGLPDDDAVTALRTTSALTRLELLRGHLAAAVAEMATLSTLDALEIATGGPDAIADLQAKAARAAAAAAAARQSGTGAATGAASGTAARPSMLGGITAFSPVDIPLGGEAGARGPGAQGRGAQGPGAQGPAEAGEALPEGSRLEYWYNEELGWISATVSSVGVRVSLTHCDEETPHETLISSSLGLRSGSRTAGQ